jgi:O-antigen ligase
MHIATISLILASSRTAPRALAIYAGGLATYCMLTTMPVSKRGLKVMVWLIVIILFITPWLLNTFDVTKLDERVGDRTLVYQASYELVLQKPWLGYGFGSTLQLEHPKLPMPDYVHHSYPGGHPHNLALLFWLEYGASGALFLCIGVWLMLNRVVEQAHGRDTMPAIAALIVTFFIMVSFSWSVWYYSIILFYAMFAGLVLLLLNIDEPTRDDPRLCVMAPVG